MARLRRPRRVQRRNPFAPARCNPVIYLISDFRLRSRAKVLRVVKSRRR
jgi:hypothetical protein